MPLNKTVRDLKDDVRGLIDELYEDGQIKSSTDIDIQTIEGNTLQYLNMGLLEVFEKTDIRKEHIITTSEIQNLLGNNREFDIVEFTGEDQIYPPTGLGVVGARGYFVTVTSDSIVKIDEFDGLTWNNLINLVNTTDEEIDVKGLITPTDPTFPIRMVMSGSTYYQHKNRCLYKYLYKNVESLPDYKAFPRYVMPDDFGSLVEVIVEQNYKLYDISGTFKWERHDLIAIDSRFKGTHRIIYNAIATKMVNDTDIITVDNQILYDFLVFYCGALVATSENTDLVQYFETKAEELRRRAFKAQPTNEHQIEDAYKSEYDYNYYNINGRYGY